MLKSFVKRLGLATADDIARARDEAMKAALESVQRDLPEFVAAYAGAHEWDVPDPSIYASQAALMAKVVYLYTAVTLTAQSAAKQDYDVYVGEREIKNHPLEKLLDAPNPMMTGFEFMRDHYTYMLLNKQCYWWLNRTTENDAPSEIWIIPPGNIQARPDETLGIREYWYAPGDGQIVVIPTYQILWFRGFHPSNMYASLSPIEPLSLTIQTDIDTQKFLRTVYGKNSGRLPGIIAFKSPVSDDDWKKIKRDVANSSEERNYMLLRGVGDGVTWLQAASNLSEMETMQGRQMNREDIYNAIAPGLYNMTDVSATEANAKVGKEVFAEFTLLPMFTDTAQKINKDLCPAFGPDVSIEYDNPVQKDITTEILQTDQYSRFATVNEVRTERLNLKPLAPTDPRGQMFAAQVTVAPPAVAPPRTEPEAAPPARELSAEISDADTEEENAIAAELQNWQKFAHKRHGQKGARMFEPRVIPPRLAWRLQAALSKAQSPADIDAAFVGAAQDIPAIVLANAINRLANG